LYHKNFIHSKVLLDFVENCVLGLIRKRNFSAILKLSPTKEKTYNIFSILTKIILQKIFPNPKFKFKKKHIIIKGMIKNHRERKM